MTKERISKVTGKPVQKRNYTKPTGRPTVFSKDMARQAKLLAEKGFTDLEMSKVLGITQRTFNNWKVANPKFFHTLKIAKEIADRKVERSLYERACGYEHPDTHISNYQGKITITDITKHFPPDPTSMIFWLKNRQPDKWQDKQDIEVVVKPLVVFDENDGR